MAHPRFVQQQLLDIIRTAFDNSRDLPTDEAIAERLGLSGVEAARSLYADLADRGDITIKGFGPTRTITLGRNAVAPPPVRPTPAVVKRTAGARDGSLEAGLAKINATLARGRAAVAPETTRAAPDDQIPVSPDVDRSTGPDEDGEGAQPGSLLAPVAAPHPIVGVEMPRHPTPAPEPKAPPRVAAAAVSDRRQLSIALPRDEFAKLEELAEAAGVMPGRHARDLMLALLNDRLPTSTTRSVIPASIAAAAIRDSHPVVEFAQRMMTLGLAAYSHEMAMA